MARRHLRADKQPVLLPLPGKKNRLKFRGMTTTPYILPFSQSGTADLPVVGGKGANLGEMARTGLPVPPGFCLTTAAFAAFLTGADAAWLYGRLDQIQAGDLAAARQVGQEIRAHLQQTAVPDTVAAAVRAAWQAQGVTHAYAVRSSATAEDLPDASFAGQQDTYLNVRGETDLLTAVKKCWISLFTDRAILYRMQNGFNHRDVSLAVVVQQMVFPDVSGILFTADPVTNHRGIASIDASYGLGEALVSGLVSADLYKIDKRSWQVVETQIADKQLAIRPSPDGGTFQEALAEPQRQASVLTDQQAVALAQLGASIEAHYGRPQDIEWAMADEQLYLLQTRPITSLFPVPEPLPADDDLHVYFSFGHGQMMTDPLPALSASIWRLILPFGRPAGLAYNPYMLMAAGRLYVDLAPLLHNHLGHRMFPKAMTLADPLTAAALQRVISRTEFKQRAAPAVKIYQLAQILLPVLWQTLLLLWRQQPETGVTAASGFIEAYDAQAQQQLAAAPDHLRLQTAQHLISRVFPDYAMRLPPYIAAGIMARVLLERVAGHHADPADITAVQRGLSGNVTTDMDLRVGDLADAARRSPELVYCLLTHDPQTALDTAVTLPGGAEFLAAWQSFIHEYGMRGPSEIDISRPRWRDDPASLIQVVIGNLQTDEIGGHRRHHQQLVAEAEAAAARLIQGAQRGIGGRIRMAVVRRLVRAARGYLPIREHPKFMLIRLLGHTRQIILEIADQWVADGRIRHRDDIWHLELHEVVDALANPLEDVRPCIDQRQADMARYRQMRPPRLITSDGEIPPTQYANVNIPPGALPGSPVSAGVIEGLAHVILDPTKEALQKGEILVAPFTDPGWTPLFINAAGLVLEVGGLMTHGSVVAREYGIPAVVGVVDATSHIRTGQRIRVQGDLGYVEVLNEI